MGSLHEVTIPFLKNIRFFYGEVETILIYNKIVNTKFIM